MVGFLADENISPETADFLEGMGYSCYSILRDGPRRISDRQIARMARESGRVIITHDLDFGQIFYFSEPGQLGVIVLRLKEQTVESVNEVLGRFLQAADIEVDALVHSLVILSERQYRIFGGPRGEF